MMPQAGAELVPVPDRLPREPTVTKERGNHYGDKEIRNGN